MLLILQNVHDICFKLKEKVKNKEETLPQLINYVWAIFPWNYKTTTSFLQLQEQTYKVSLALTGNNRGHHAGFSYAPQMAAEYGRLHELLRFLWVMVRSLESMPTSDRLNITRTITKKNNDKQMQQKMWGIMIEGDLIRFPIQTLRPVRPLETLLRFDVLGSTQGGWKWL